MKNDVLDVQLLSGYLQSLSINMVEQMLSLYEQQSEKYLADIEHALNEDNDLWRTCCHKMKGAAGSVGLTLLHTHLVEMEKSTGNITTKTKMLSELKNNNVQGIESFKQWLNAQ